MKPPSLRGPSNHSNILGYLIQVASSSSPAAVVVLTLMTTTTATTATTSATTTGKIVYPKKRDVFRQSAQKHFSQALPFECHQLSVEVYSRSLQIVRRGNPSTLTPSICRHVMICKQSKCSKQQRTSFCGQSIGV